MFIYILIVFFLQGGLPPCFPFVPISQRSIPAAKLDSRGKGEPSSSNSNIVKRGRVLVNPFGGCCEAGLLGKGMNKYDNYQTDTTLLTSHAIILSSPTIYYGGLLTSLFPLPTATPSPPRCLVVSLSFCLMTWLDSPLLFPYIIM